MGKRLFITGIPTGGKSYLAKRLAEATGGIHVDIDGIREEKYHDPRFTKWIDFYFNQDEKIYYTSGNNDEKWNDLVMQSEGLWPGVLEKIHEYDNEDKIVIFEGVNILPHLAHKDLSFPGIAIIGTSFEETLKRNMEDPRWGQTEELQKLEAEHFFNGERPRYKAEAEKYGYKVYESADEAFEEVLAMLK